MKRHKNLERAIVLGLMLSTGIYGTAFAETMDKGLWDNNVNKVVTDGDLTIDAGSKTGIGFNGTVNVENGDLTITTTYNGIEAGYVKDATVNISANNVIINSGENGLFSGIEGYSGTINIGSIDRKVSDLHINASGQGVDNKSGHVNIYGSKDSTISIKTDSTKGIMSNQDGIYNGNGQVNIEGGNIIISADYGYGINNNSDKVKIDATGSVNIASYDKVEKLLSINNAGINNTQGTTEITAQQGVSIDSSNNGIYATKGVVTLNGGTINKIDAVNTGIYASGSDTLVTLSAENNIINIENNDGGAIGVHTENGATKDIISEGKTEIIVSGTKDNILGIHVDKNSTVNVDAGALSIDVTAKEDNDVDNLGGIYVGSLNGKYIGTFVAKVDNNIDINVTTNKALNNGKYAAGIVVGKKSNANLTSSNGNISIEVKDAVDFADKESNKYGILAEENSITNVTATNGTVFVEVGEEGKYTGNSHAVSAQDAIVNITAGKDIILNSYSKGLATSLNGGGILADNSKVIANASGAFSVHSESSLDTVNSVNYGLHGMLVNNNETGISITANKVNIESSGYSSNAIRSDNGAGLNIQAGNEGIRTQAKGSEGYAYAIYVDKVEDAKLNTTGNVVIAAENNSDAQGAYGIFSNAINDKNKLTIDGASVSITAMNQQGSATGILVQDRYYTNVPEEWPEEYINQTNIVSDKDIIINVSSAKSYSTGVNVYNSDLNLTSENGSTFIISDGSDNSYGMYVRSTAIAQGEIAGNSNINVTSAVDNYVESSGYGVISWYDNSTVNFTAENGSNIIRATKDGLWNYGKAQINMVADNGINYVEAISSNEKNLGIAVLANDGLVDLQGKYNVLNTTYSDKIGFGGGHVIQADTSATVNLNATAGDNILAGVIYAKDEGTNVTLSHKNGTDIGSGSNYIYSSAHGSTDGVSDRSDVVAAVYAQSNGEVNIVAGKDGYNYIATDATLTNDKDREQTVWAQQGGKINIDGQTTIVASNADVNTNNIGSNSLGIAITAGTGDISGLEELPPLNTTQDGNEIRSTVNITNASGSSITGDIVSGYGGLINIGMDVNNKTRAAGTVENIKITGNALAANGGKLNINLGNGGTWTGRADDYGDAGYGPDAENHQNFYNPAFSNTILEGGTVNLTMGDNSTWKVQGQSWITSVDTTNAQNATIDLVEANTDRNTTSRALTIYDLKGNANINMSLDGNRDVSDMLYIKNAQGEYNVALADAVTTEDMYANGFDGLRFATVGAGSNVRFNAGSYDAGVFNVEYEVGTDAYDGNSENSAYNGDSLDVEKPGTSTVDKFFGYQGEDPNAEENTSEIATYARMAEEPQVMALAEEPVTETTATTKEATATGATNYKLIARKGESLSDAGKTILNMSKANYSQAVYLDTLNKRLGEARYLEGDEGLWIRMRHDKIDKDSSYEITNNMYELGYDKKYESKDKNGYHRKGVAIDYMDGDTSYDDIAGSGETNRKGIWLYDTWIGNKGHYTDYVAKWGHLENSFDLYTKTRGEKVSGEYDNDVYSLSAEWGYKDQLNNDWYIEPQVQLQYARVTGADYETSQGTQVSVDGIDSLIARAGFRLGKDFGEEKKSTFYVKADVLHEFLGDQDITAIDKTTDGKLVSIGYDNDGTWYSVGLGFSTMLSDNSYAFLDVEKLFGNDNDNSYQINGGFNWLL